MHRVLVVDDEYDIRELFVDIITGLGHEIETAKNGKEGLNLFKSQSFDIAFIDIKMPVMDGLQCARKIKELNPAFPIVMMTGVLQEYSREQIFAAGVNHLMEKPLFLSEIKEVLQKYFK